MSKNNENIFPAHLAIEALKYGPYSDSAAALAEIIDNSVDAGAEKIHVVAFAKNQTTESIAVLDNGKGMNASTLRRSIQYGRHVSEDENNPNQRKKLGRFGVGLISASINQCNLLNIWSWTEGMALQKNDERMANKVSINVDSIRDSGEAILPGVSEEKLPDDFTSAFCDFPGIQENALLTGTLVEWREFHNLKWKRASTLCDHVKSICGRVYRNYIRDKKLQISLLVFDVDTKQILDKMEVPAFDPMFLSVWKNTALKTFSSELSMFQPFNPNDPTDKNFYNEDGTPMIIKKRVLDDDERLIGEYQLQFSHRRMPDVVQRAKEKDIAGKDPGDAPFGKLAKRCRGVSILREGRELTLSRAWLKDDSTIDRWIKASIDFPPSLDQFFGVSHNKQSAIHLDSLASVSLQELTSSDFDDVPNRWVLEAAIAIKRGLDAMRKKVREERALERSRSGGSHTQVPEDVSPKNLSILSRQVEKRASKHHIPSDDKMPDKDGFSDVYENTQHRGEKAGKVRPQVVLDYKLKVDFVVSDKDLGASIFTARESNGMILVILNQDHPLYEQISDVLAPVNGNGDSDEASEAKTTREKLDSAIWVIQRLFYSFARAECEAHEYGGDKHDEFEQVRISWGRVAKFILRNEDD